MKHHHNSQFSLLLAGVILFTCGLLVVAPAHAAVTTAFQPAAGVSVSIDNTTGRNQIVIQIGEDSLAIDFPSSSGTGSSPRYRLSTDSLAPPSDDGAIELWPESRPRDGSEAAHAVVVFSTGFTLAAADRQVVFFDLGRCATAGDTAVWLPGQRILITGRLASAGRAEATVDTDLVAWTRGLERLLGLGPKVVIPGHGGAGGAEVLSDQIDRLHALQQEVEGGLLQGLDADKIAAESTLDWFVDWRQHDSLAATSAVDAMVYEVGGLRTPWELKERRMLREGNSPNKADPDWARTSKMPMLSLAQPQLICSLPGQTSVGSRSDLPASNDTWHFHSWEAAKCCSRMVKNSPLPKSPNTSWPSPGPWREASVTRSPRRMTGTGSDLTSATKLHSFGCVVKHCS
jgi:glyoxylase-like metal-dependent hydrolase (beta-lactamase superfamily II)